MKRLILTTGLVLVLIGAAGSKEKPKDKAREVVEQSFAAWNSHDPDRVASLYAEDIAYEDIAFGMSAHGRAEMRKMAADFFAGVPDLKLEYVSASLNGNHGDTEWVFSGTDVGLYKTGKKFTVRGASIFEMRNGKVAQNKDFYDAATIMRQVGVLPKP